MATHNYLIMNILYDVVAVVTKNRQSFFCTFLYRPILLKLYLLNILILIINDYNDYYNIYIIIYQVVRAVVTE